MAGRETVDRVIGNNNYRTTQLGAIAGRKMIPRLQGMAEGGFTEDFIEYACKVFGPLSAVEVAPGKWPALTEGLQDSHFSGNYDELMKWIVFCVEVNFSDFLGTSKTESP